MRSMGGVVAVVVIWGGTASGSAQTKPQAAPQKATEKGTPPPVTEYDERILLRADELLKDESLWNRSDDRICDDDERQGKRSLFCALQKACIEVVGEYQHR